MIRKIINVNWINHAFWTAAAVTIALFCAKLLGLAEYYWAPISAIIVMQSTLGQAWDTSKHRLIGTVIGALFAGAYSAVFTEVSTLMFGLSVFVLGIVCAFLRLTVSAYRLGGVTFAIIMLMHHNEVAWRIGVDRIIEVSTGICAALLVSAVGPRSPFMRMPKERRLEHR